MRLGKIITRQILSPLGMLLKGDKFLRNMSRHNIINIMYHGVVSDDSTYFSPRHIHIDQFEKQIKYLKKEFDVLTIEEAFELKKNGSTSKNKAITITFDDGYMNNLYAALPILEANSVNATFYISSICIEDSNYVLWSDLIAALKYFYKNETLEIEIQKLFHLNTFNLSITDLIKSLKFGERETFLEQLIEKYNLISKIKTLPEEIWRLMNKEELTQLSKSKCVTIGSHGHLHYNLSNISKEDARSELSKSKNLLESNLGVNITSVAFPDGSYDQEIKEIALSLGYQHQLAVNYKLPNDKNDISILNRHGISSTTTFESNILLLSKSFKTKGF